MSKGGGGGGGVGGGGGGLKGKWLAYQRSRPGVLENPPKPRILIGGGEGSKAI